MIGYGAHPQRHLIEGAQHRFFLAFGATPEAALDGADMIGFQHGDRAPVLQRIACRSRNSHAASALLSPSHLSRSAFARALIARFLAAPRSGPRNFCSIGGKRPKLIFIGW